MVQYLLYADGVGYSRSPESVVFRTDTQLFEFEI
jgi:hypothetical protein